MSDLIEQMKVVLASTFSTYLKAHNYHWNVIGPNFAQYHSFFGSYYEEVWSSVDDIAEHIRSLDSFVPGSLARFSELSLVSDELNIIAPEQMFKNLYDANELLITEMTKARSLAEAQSAFGLINFLEGRLDYHSKMHWQIKAFFTKLSSATTPVAAATE